MTYSQKSIWYIEARSWNGSRENPAYAPAEPAVMGTGVVVYLEQLDDDGSPLNPPAVGKYLLTCSHVVRDGPGGALFEEIFCWQHGMGYIRTLPNSRKSGQHDGPFAAKVSMLSPCRGQLGAQVPPPDAAGDWVLLEVDDDRFRNSPAIRNWGVVNRQSELRIIGFPGGAGFLRDRGTGHFVRSGEVLESLDSAGFRQDRIPNAGTLRLDKGEGTRPGMSGGCVLDAATGELVGIHLASTDAALERVAIAADGIRDWLYANRRVRPAASPPAAQAIGTPSAAGAPMAFNPIVVHDLVLGIAPKIPFFNRNLLRINLASLASPNNTYKVVSLLGEKGTGKSHSLHLIRHVAQGLGVNLAFLDISDAITVDLACETLAEQMGLDLRTLHESVLSDKPTPDRIGKKFSAWLATNTHALKPARWWVVLDGLDESDGPSAELRDCFMQPIINALSSHPRFTQVVLILLGHRPARNPLLHPYTLQETLEKITEEDVRRFVKNYAASIGRLLLPEELEAVVLAITGEAVGPYDQEQMDSITGEAINVIERVLV